MPVSESDIPFMRRALELAERGRGWTSPNPMVGAVVVRDGRIVGEGYHARAGEAHAEPNALRAAGSLAAGGALYVTLEPCCHQGRTPPCTGAIIAAGIVRVVAAMADPDSRVSGKGLTLLRDAGIRVEVGVLEKEARRLNAPYIHHRQTGLPYVVLKWAQTLDGRAAARAGRAEWITGPEARARAHRLRSESDGVLVGVGTVLADDPQLTVRLVEGRQPRRLVLDSLARTPLSARLLDGTAPTTIFATDRAPAERVAGLRNAGAEVAVLPETPEGRVDLSALKQELGRRETVTLLVEGGPRVATALLRARAVDRVVCFVAPVVLGAGIDAVGDLNVLRVPDGIRLRDTTVERVGEDVMIAGTPVYPVMRDE